MTSKREKPIRKDKIDDSFFKKLFPPPPSPPNFKNFFLVVAKFVLKTVSRRLLYDSQICSFEDF